MYLLSECYGEIMYGVQQFFIFSRSKMRQIQVFTNKTFCFLHKIRITMIFCNIVVDEKEKFNNLQPID